jgi:hypothetical protein
MKIADMLLPELDHEAAVTRRLLERVPEGRAGWTPHLRSRTLADLCLHLATLPAWALIVMRQTAFDLSPPDGVPFPRVAFESHAATLSVFDEHVGRARAEIVPASDPELLVTWTLLDAGRPMFTLPRVAALRSFVLNHMIHHRGQLSVYLRLCDVALPPIYGPTGDTAGAGSIREE